MSKKATRRAFGTVTKLPSGMYRARYVGPDKEKCSAAVTFVSKMDAEAWLNAERLLIERDQWEPPAVRYRRQRFQGVTLVEYATQWLDLSTVRDTTLARYKSSLRLYILPGLGETRLTELTRDDIAAWWRHLPRRSRRRSCDLAYQLLREILAAAVDSEIIDVNPARLKDAGKSSRRRTIVPLKPEQVFALADNFGPRIDAQAGSIATTRPWRLAVLIAGFMGLRPGEIFGLQRGDIDLAAGCITVNRGITRLNGEMVEGPTKTGDDGEHVARIPEPLRQDMRDHLNRVAQLGKTGKLFYTLDTGDYVDDNTRRRAWRNACRATGTPERYVLYDLRRSCVTMLSTHGATAREQMTATNHKTPTMALRYQQVDDAHLSAVYAAIDRDIAEARP